MQPPPARATPLPGNAGSIVPCQLWAHLTPSQQHHLRQTLIVIGQQWLDHLLHQPLPAESSHEC